MNFIIGVLLLFGGVAGLLLARARNGKPRFFINTKLELPIVLLIFGTLAAGMVLTIVGVTELRS